MGEKQGLYWFGVASIIMGLCLIGFFLGEANKERDYYHDEYIKEIQKLDERLRKVEQWMNTK